MDAMMYYMEQYQELLLFGVVMNLVTTIGFGVYKSYNLKYEQMVYLVQTYPAKTNIVKILSFWFVPYMGFLFVFKDVLSLQNYLNGGRTVFEYVEDRLKAETAKQA